MNPNAVSQVIKRLEFDEPLTGHGWRLSRVRYVQHCRGYLVRLEQAAPEWSLRGSRFVCWRLRRPGSVAVLVDFNLCPASGAAKLTPFGEVPFLHMVVDERGTHPRSQLDHIQVDEAGDVLVLLGVAHRDTSRVH